jgi:tetratricopeptide (TPR) repeat protein
VNAKEWRAQAREATAAGDHARALDCYKKACEAEPDDAELQLELANANARAGDKLSAVQAYVKQLRLTPESCDCWNNLGVTLLELGHTQTAVDCYQNAVRLRPDDSGYRYNLGRALDTMGRHAEALEHLRLASASSPSHADAWLNLGNVHQNLGHFEEALECFDRALALSDTPAEVHVNRAMILLNRGDFREGWSEYEHRWETAGFRVYKKYSFGGARWKGESLQGKTILLHAEQGFGDAIQFARFIPAVAAQAQEVFLEVAEPLRGLLEPMVAPRNLCVRGETLPVCDYHCSLLSLPFALGVAVGAIPGTPYLAVSQEVREIAARALLPRSSDRIRVGLCWRGNPTHRWNAIRSIDLGQLNALAEVAGIDWVLLQRDATSEERVHFSSQFHGQDLPPEQMTDFLAMAGLMEQLDLVISVDTANAHLAGALGKNLWLLIPPYNDWRWHAHLTVSPWYPSARLFRQPEPGNWTGAIERVAAELAARGATSH